MRLFINGHKMPLNNPSKLAQNKQVNSLFSLETRQTNYTNAITLPNTSYVRKALGFLGVAGNQSNTPYQLNEAYLYSDSGECFVYKGRAVINKVTPVSVTIQVIDGNVDLYKDIANAKLSDLTLDEINHVKNITTIKNSWLSNLNYKYIVADYNGKAMINGNTLNADFLVPSAKISYLWIKIFQHYGYTFSGSYFQTEDFLNSWITFPKGVTAGSSSQDIFISDDWRLTNENGNFYTAIRMKYNSWSTFNLLSAVDQTHLKVNDTGQYKLTVSGKFNFQFNNSFKLALGKNQEGQTADYYTPEFLVFQNIIQSGEDFYYERIFDLQAFDSINLFAKKLGASVGDPNTTNLRFRNDVDNTLTFRLEKVNGDDISFSDAFLDFETKDFFNDIINRGSLIPIKDKYTNHYRFLTFEEILSNTNVYDWSNKFPAIKEESYLYGAYARRNFYRYNYNDKEADYNDGFIDVDNVNLDAKKDIFISRFYSPEKDKTTILSNPSNVYKMWEKEIDDDGNTKYKNNDKRYYILRSSNKTTSAPQVLKSEYTGETYNFYSYPMESFYGLDFDSIISDKYRNIGAVINRAVVLSTVVVLNDYDVSNFDFSRMVYVKQLGGYFICNKISNFLLGKPVTVELVKIDFADVENIIIPPPPVIQSITTEPQSTANYFMVTINYDSSFFNTPMILAEFTTVGYDITFDNDGVLQYSFYGVAGSTISVKLKNNVAETETQTFTLN